MQTDMGGEAAPLDVATSTASMTSVIVNAQPSKELRYVNHKGEAMPF